MRKDEALFGSLSVLTPGRNFCIPPVIRLWSATRDGDSFQINPESDEPQKYAFIGVRACKLHAIAVQDKVFLEGPYVDPHYQARRQNVFIVAVNCGQAGNTCFCVSMNTGPKITFGFDLALTEIIEGERHYFVVDAGTEKGEEILSGSSPWRLMQRRN